MFQRIKGAIDSRIAEEQARQKATASAPPLSRSASATGRPSLSSRTDSPSRRPRKPRPKEDDEPPAKGPDPSEFEAAFVIDDESEGPTRTGILVAMDEKTSQVEGNAPSEKTKEKENGVETPANAAPKAVELPQDVRTKLRKLEKLESRYQELLRSYRIAHGRAVSIEPFEKALKENTPLTTIGDPEALVEYLNQLNLKGDMVMDELKRVSGDRDQQKKRIEEVEQENIVLKEELANLKDTKKPDEVPSEKADTGSIDTPAASIMSPVTSVLGIFSPKQKPQVTEDNKDVSEDFFSYDEELPQLQSEIKAKTTEIEELKTKVTTLENELTVARESSSGLVANLEETARELNESKDASKRLTEDLDKVKEELDESKRASDTLTSDLNAAKNELSDSKAAILDAGRKNTELSDTQKAEVEKIMENLRETEVKLTQLETDLVVQKEIVDEKTKSQEKVTAEVKESTVKLNSQIKSLEQDKAKNAKRVQELEAELESLNKPTEETQPGSTEAPVPAESAAPASTAAKKKNKKKKKGGNAAAAAVSKDAADVVEKGGDTAPPTPIASDLEAEISRLKEEVASKDAEIAKLQSKRKTEADLREELENMQDNFLQVGQEHVEAKEKIKALQAEKVALEKRVTSLESEIETNKKEAKSSGKLETDLKSLTAEYEDLKIKSATLQTDLGAAQQLATSRYKELTQLQDILQKAQPELRSLRAENANMKVTKEELNTRTAELRRLEAREKDLKADIASFKKQASDRDGELRTLNEKIVQETNSRLKAEDQARIAGRDMRKAEADKISLSASGEKASRELAEVQEEAGKLRTKVRDLEEQVAKLTTESKGLREEVELRGSQYNNAQGLLGSMRDQSAEMAMQLKEAKEQSESLEEELGEVQRLLSERTREGETMRRLLADVDDRANTKVREMRERMEAAIEERDRAEDEASTDGRRRAREVDELKNKIRDAEREFKRTSDERDELEHAQKEWKRRRDELETSSERAVEEANEVRTAMGQLRSALDGSEKQARDAEKQKIDLRRLLDEANVRFEKLQKEYKALQAKNSRSSSVDGSRALSPAPAVNGAAGKMDLVYLKTVLLQFLEQKDKKRQADLVPVLGRLLSFDKKDEQKWISAINAIK
ncbi:viral a-type inclusion protein repeat protein [Phlyctema vagabunda]|uniref:Viral a-type inclusion protein repeat protein n=1 Tax=Phlyctema vagabunda TaxID=108571 RepID=A0ABR4P1F2_9HELO